MMMSREWRRRRKFGDEVMEEVEWSEGGESPIQIGHHQKLHPLNGLGMEYVGGIHNLEVNEKGHAWLLHLSSQGYAGH